MARHSVIPNAKRYNVLGGKDGLPKDRYPAEDGHFQDAVWLTADSIADSTETWSQRIKHNARN